MKVAALDLGTNTFILLVVEGVVEGDQGKISRVIRDEVRVVRLGQGVHENRKFHPEALARAEACFKEFSSIIKENKVDKVLACATSAARDVSNADELINLAARYEIPLKIIPGEKEADLTFNGTIDEELKEPVVIIDVGGGSTEYILGDREGIRERISLDIGSVRLTELFVHQHPINSEEMTALANRIREELKKIPDKISSVKSMRTIAVAGTPTTLATIDQGLAFESEKVHGYSIATKRIEDWIERLAKMSVAERQKLAGMEPKRADVIVAGAMILALSAEKFSAPSLQVSIRGLRYGIAKALLGDTL